MDTWCFYALPTVTFCLNEGDFWRISVLGTGSKESLAIITHFSGIQAGSDMGYLHQDRFQWVFYMGGSDRIRLMRGLDSR